MAPRKTKKAVSANPVIPLATDLVPAVIPQKKELVLEGDPEQQLEFAGKAARALMKRVEGKTKKVIISGKQYLEYGDWQTLGRFFGATAGIEWSRPIRNDKGSVIGFEARAIVYQHGQIISSAEAQCDRTERNWGNRDDFAIRSMAQTRAAAKSLRNAFGWVAELAGYQSTPAEEMESSHYDQSPVSGEEPIVMVGTDTDDMPDDVTAQRKKLFALLQSRGVDVTSKQECQRYVADETQLELVESNFPEIIRLLQN